MKALIGVIILLISAAVIAIAVAARGPDPDSIPTTDEVNERVMSPYCPGLLLSDCPSPQGAKLRQLIEQKIEQRWSNRMIDRWLVANFGDQVLAKPKGWGAWAIPALVLGAGGGGLVFLLPRIKPSDPSQGSGQITNPTHEEQIRLEEDFRHFEGRSNE